MTNDDALQLPLLYKGKRMLIINNAKRHFADSSDDYEVIVWDRLLECEVGFCHYAEDGTFSGWVMHGMNELTIEGHDAKTLAQDAMHVVNWSLQN